MPRLLREGHRVRCLVRDAKRIRGREWQGVEIHEGDTLRPESLGPALEGVDAAYYLIHSMESGEGEFQALDRTSAANFSHAASVAGVSRIIYLGGLGGEGLSPHLRSRQETGEILRAGNVPVTEFRAAVIVGSGSLSFELIRYLVERLPVMICPRWISTRCQPIGIRSVLDYLAAALGMEEDGNRTFEIGGREILTYGEMMRIYGEIRGLRRFLIPVPVLTPNLSSYWVGLVTPIPSKLARLLIEGLRSEVVCKDRSAMEAFDIEPLSYGDSVRMALERLTGDSVETNWSGALSSIPVSRQRRVTFRDEEGLLSAERIRSVNAAPGKVFSVVAAIGGDTGWYYADWLWRLRALLDRMVGGVGFRRGRRSAARLHVGEPLDFWRVEAWEENRLLRLRAEMKMSGRAWLQFEVSPDGDSGSKIRQTAYYESKGLLGLLYWYSLFPFHQVLFSGMIDAIAARAEAGGGPETRGQ